MLAPFIINVFICFIAVGQAMQIADMAYSLEAIRKVFFIVGFNFVVSAVLTKLYLKRKIKIEKTC